MVVKVNGMQVILFGHSTVKGEDLSFKKGGNIWSQFNATYICKIIKFCKRKKYCKIKIKNKVLRKKKSFANRNKELQK